MVLELVYSDEERRVAQRASKQIYNILYKDTVAPMSCKLKLVRMTFHTQRTLSKRATRSTVLTPLIPMNPNRKTVCTRPRQEGERRGMAKGVPWTRWLGIPVR